MLKLGVKSTSIKYGKFNSNAKDKLIPPFLLLDIVYANYPAAAIALFNLRKTLPKMEV
jgi:hypothetical protein